MRENEKKVDVKDDLSDLYRYEKMYGIWFSISACSFVVKKLFMTFIVCCTDFFALNNC